MLTSDLDLQIATPRWAVPLLEPARYKGGKGGRSSGKSHFFAEMLAEEHVAMPDLQSVCIREIQRSLKFSAKKLIEDKIRSMGVSHLFDITLTEIRRIGHEGIIIFQGMQDHTAESIKSLEGFDRAWCEEAQSLSARSMELLLPTIRSPGSQIWFSWNPERPDDPVDELFKQDDDDMISVHVNYLDNPFCPDEVIKEADRHKRHNPDTFGHVWLGEYNLMSDEIVFSGKWREDETIKPSELDNIYYGADWGFAVDPSVLLRCWVSEDKREIYIDHEAYQSGVEIDDLPAMFDGVPGSRKNKITADCARPETISYLNRNGFWVVGARKGKDSVIEGVNFLQSYTIVVHPRCDKLIRELNAYRFKVDKRNGDILPILVDKDNHCIDSLRYSVESLMFAQGQEMAKLLNMAMGE